MICYKDTTFCSEDKCGNIDCNRNVTADVVAASQAWWNKGVDISEWTPAPIAVQDLKDTFECPGYVMRP